MIRYINTFKEAFSTRLALLMMVLLGTGTAAQADNVVSIADFSIAPGEQKEISLNLDNADDIVKTVMGKITVPAGLTIVTNAYGTGKHAASTKERPSDLVNMNPLTGQFSVKNTSGFAGNSGAVMTFKVKADESLAATSTITIEAQVVNTDNVTTDATTSPCTVTLTSDTPDDPDTPEPVDNNVSIAFNPASLTLNAGETTDIEVVLSNDAELTGFQAVVAAQEGVTIKSVAKADRTPAFFAYNKANGMIIVNGGITGNDGVLFTVTIEADGAFSGSTAITLSDVHANGADAVDIALDDQTVEIFVNGEAAANAVFAFDPAEVILSAGKTVDVDVTLTNEVDLTFFQATLSLPEGVTATITNGQRAGKVQYVAQTGMIVGSGGISGNEGVLFTITLSADETFNADATAELSELNVTTAAANNYESAAITLTIKAKDEALYQELKDEVAALQKKLEDAKTAIAADDADVADQFADAIAAIQKEIQELDEAIDEAYENNTLSKETVEPQVEAISAEIDKLKSDADAAEEAFKANQEKQELINELLAEIENLQQKLNNAVTDINNNYPEVVAEDAMKDAVNSIQQAIDQLRNEVTSAENPDKETVMKQVKKISNDIDNLLPQAEQLYQELVDQNYEEQKDNISDLQELFDAAKEKIANDYPSVADDEELVAEEKDIQDAIDQLAADLDDQYYYGYLTPDDEVDTDDIRDAIDQLLEDAARIWAENRIPGDVEHDKDVDTDDLHQLISELLEGAEMPEKDTDAFVRYDANEDGQINIADARAIVNIIVWGRAYGEKPDFSRGGNAQGSDMLSLRTEQHGNVTRHYLMLKNSAEYAAFQADVQLSAGLVVADEQLADRSSAMTLRSNDRGSVHRVIAFADGNETITGNEGAVYYIDVMGQGTVNFSNIIFAQTDAQAVAFNLSGTTTGISTVGVQDADSQVFTLDGKQQRTLQKGVNVVRSAQGVRKVMK